MQIISENLGTGRLARARNAADANHQRTGLDVFVHSSGSSFREHFTDTTFSISFPGKSQARVSLVGSRCRWRVNGGRRDESVGRWRVRNNSNHDGDDEDGRTGLESS